MNENSAIWINTMDKQSGNRSATGRRGRRDGRVHEALRGRARPRRGGVLQGAGRGRRGARGAPHRRRRGLRGRLLRRRQEVAAGLGWAGLGWALHRTYLYAQNISTIPYITFYT